MVTWNFQREKSKNYSCQGYITFLILQWNYWVTSASPQPWPLSPCLTTWVVVATYSGQSGKDGRRTSPASFVGKRLLWGETIWDMWMLCIWSINPSCVTCATTPSPTWKRCTDTERDAVCSWSLQLISNNRPGSLVCFVLQVISFHCLGMWGGGVVKWYTKLTCTDLNVSTSLWL